MRTTINLDDDVHLAAREIAHVRRSTLGKVISDLARQGLTHPVKFKTRNGFPQFPVQPGAGHATLELVNRLRDEDP